MSIITDTSNKYNAILEILQELENISEMSTDAKRKVEELRKAVDSLGASLHTYLMECLNTATNSKENSVCEQQLKNIEENTPKDTFEYYADIVRKDYADCWDDMEENTQKFLVTSYYIYNILKAENIDFSPVMVEFAKSLEEEMKQKIYYPFIVEQSKEEKILIEDSELEKCIIKYKYDNVFFVPLSLMFTSLQKPTGEVRYHSLLHKMLRDEHWQMRIIADKSFINDGKEYTKKYRNVAAHTSALVKEDAENCKNKTFDLLNTFLSAKPVSKSK